MTEVLPEVAVADADPETKHIYERIMSLTGVGSPALIYRHFATYPGLLPWAWDIIGPELESGRVVGHALDAVARTPVIGLPAVAEETFQNTGVDARSRQLIDGMLATYNRMNPVNLSLISSIRTLIDPAAPKATPATPLADVAPPLPAVSIALPAPVNLSDMNEDVRATVLQLSAAIPSPGTQVIPTLYRHLAIWPKFLLHLTPGLLAAMQRGEVEARMHDLISAMTPVTQSVTARARARNLGTPPLGDPQAMLKTLDAFLYTIPQLVVVGTALRRSIPVYEA
jgi:hypothetical protein